MSNATTDWNIWPSDDMNFWKLTDSSNIVTIKWTRNTFNDYKKHSYDFYICGNEIFIETIERDPCNTKSDMWFLTGVFLLRQSIELGLKALICRIVSPNCVTPIFTECCHNLYMLLERYTTLSSENFLSTEELEWLNQYFDAVEYIDQKSDMFRFPFDDDFLKKYRDKFLDTAATANNLLQAFSLVRKCLEEGNCCSAEPSKLDLFPDFLILANSGFGNCYLWQPISDDGFHVKVKGYTEVSEYVFHTPNIALENKIYPLIFMLRNTVELSLKRVFYKNLEHGISKEVFDAKRKSHLIKKDLWKNVKPVLWQYANAQSQDTEVLETVEYLLFSIDALDKKGYTFRYPTTYGLQYNFNDKTIDLRNVYEYFRAIINFLEGCDYMLEDISDYETEMRAECQSYYDAY